LNTAIFSDCKQYRYTLARGWDAAKPTLAYCGLNPSTASADVEDATSLRFKGFAKTLGYGGYVTGNLFAFISTDPSDLRAAKYPVGPENDDHLARIFADRNVICCWGGKAAGLPRARDVMALILRVGGRPLAFKVNGDGTPGHPLYLLGDTVPQPYAMKGM
jgi:hypothetical protein